MDPPISYVSLLLIFVVALVLLSLQILAKRNRRNHSTELQKLLAESSADPDELYKEYLPSLLLYEEDYPSFANIIGLVLHRFPLQRFLEEQEFETALAYLRDSVFQGSSRRHTVAAMCTVVNGLISDPDVEYLYRERIHSLVEQFLVEVGVQSSSSKGDDTSF